MIKINVEQIKKHYTLIVVLLAGGAIYGFYIHDYFQAMMCVADIGFFVYAYEHFNK